MATTTSPGRTPPSPPCPLPPEAPSNAVRRLRQSGDSDLLRVDLTADQSARLMTDLRRLRAGRVGAQFWSVYVPCGADLAALAEQVDLVHRLVARYPDALRFAWSADDVLAARQEGKLASLLGMEGAGPLNGSLAALRLLPRLGVRYMTLTHACSNAWAASCADSRGPPSGLSAEGAAAVAAMNAVGLLVDISHVSADAMRAVLRVTRAPVIFSHSNAFAVCNNSRNVPDDVLAALPANGGVLLVTFVPAFLSQRLLDAQRAAAPPAEQAALLATVGVEDVVAHIEHVARVAGRAHVGFGADLDGFDGPAPALASVAAYPTVVDALAQRGWRADELAALMSGNVLRVMRAAEAVAAELTGN